MVYVIRNTFIAFFIKRSYKHCECRKLYVYSTTSENVTYSYLLQPILNLARQNIRSNVADGTIKYSKKRYIFV